ncbi:hypothetical protein [Schlesneria paludicola]|uniref:hypothetical protein n=1 Tax=Schlesneria paludicola TaxID=360056 RepID=UPI00029AC03A|nr:hypothetical protein [Schlesneria paludicola]
MDKINPTENVLTDLELMAIAGVVKETQLGQLKGAMKEGASGMVDFKVHIRGNVQKGMGSAGGPTSYPATVSLVSLPIFCAVLACLGVGKDRLRRALEEIDPSKVQVNASLSEVFDKVAAEKAAKLPPVKGWASGRAGSVTSQLSAEKIA